MTETSKQSSVTMWPWLLASTVLLLNINYVPFFFQSMLLLAPLALLLWPGSEAFFRPYKRFARYGWVSLQRAKRLGGAAEQQQQQQRAAAAAAAPAPPQRQQQRASRATRAMVPAPVQPLDYRARQEMQWTRQQQRQTQAPLPRASERQQLPPGRYAALQQVQAQQQQPWATPAPQWSEQQQQQYMPWPQPPSGQAYRSSSAAAGLRPQGPASAWPPRSGSWSRGPASDWPQPADYYPPVQGPASAWPMAETGDRSSLPMPGMGPARCAGAKPSARQEQQAEPVRVWPQEQLQQEQRQQQGQPQRPIRRSRLLGDGGTAAPTSPAASRLPQQASPRLKSPRLASGSYDDGDF